MPEIMSAEELEYEITWGEISDSTRYIRSRDSAMLEKYKEAMMKRYDECFANKNMSRDLFVSALDSAFAEIEGGK
jgi:hypothetical protein